MTGYRDVASGFDPNVHQQPGPPVRPYNALQWLGVAVGTLGIVYALVYIAGQRGWIDLELGSAFPGVMLCILGTVLINSRRQPAVTVGSEQLARNRRTLLVTLAIVLLLLGLAGALVALGVAQ